MPLYAVPAWMALSL